MTNKSIPGYIFDGIKAELSNITFSRECLFRCWNNAYNIVCFIYKVKSPEELDYITKITELVYWTSELLLMCNNEDAF